MGYLAYRFPKEFISFMSQRLAVPFRWLHHLHLQEDSHEVVRGCTLKDFTYCGRRLLVLKALHVAMWVIYVCTLTDNQSCGKLDQPQFKYTIASSVQNPCDGK